MQYEILYHRTASWLVGETKTNRAARMRAMIPSETANSYRDGYDGKIISWRPVDDARPTLANMSDKDHPVLILDLQNPPDGKIVNGGLVPITFDDRFGAVAVKLRESHADPEQWELDERTRIESAESANATTINDYTTEMEEYQALKATFAVDIIEANRLGTKPPDFPVAPKMGMLTDVGVSSFDTEVLTLAKSLPATVTNTGTGLYAVKDTPTKLDRTQDGAPAGQVITITVGGLGVADAYKGGYILNVTETETLAIVSHTDDTITLEGDLTNWSNTDDLDIFDSWSTIQAALDQLFTDQGVGAFTFSQYVRVFAGTYDENVVPNATLDPNETYGYILIIEGDPDDDRADIVLEPSAGIYSFTSGAECMLLRHLTIQGNPSSHVVYFTGTDCEINDCAVTGPGANYVVRSSQDMRVIRCAITIGTSGSGIYAPGPVLVDLCDFVGQGKTATGGDALFWASSWVVRACTFRDLNTALGALNRSNIRAFVEISQCSVYNCVYGWFLQFSMSRVRLVNNIFEDCTNVLNWRYVMPVESATQYQAPFVMRNNCFHGYTTFAFSPTVGSESFATFTARDAVDAAGNLDQTDPLMTNPGSGDFSLQAGSPAIHKGMGSGVVTDVLGAVFDPYHPDIGAVSTGIGPNVVSGG